MFNEDDPHVRSRIASCILGVSYVAIGLAGGGAEGALRAFAFCIIPVASIWFPQAVGDFVGSRITQQSPAVVVWFLAWAVLLLPLLVMLGFWLAGLWTVSLL